VFTLCVLPFHTQRRFHDPLPLDRQKVDLPPLGVAGAPGAIATGSGLLFTSGGGNALYAIDAKDGRALWSHDLGQRAYAVPMTYVTSSGRQFVVIASGGGDSSRLTAFALP